MVQSSIEGANEQRRTDFRDRRAGETNAGSDPAVLNID
jgi:hypothetical protein